MKKSFVAASFVAACALASPSAALVHGGMYRGPGDTVPPGGYGGGGRGGPGAAPGLAGPSGPGGPGATTPGGTSPGGPGGAPGGLAVTSGGGQGGGDLSSWRIWWEFNKEPFLDLRAKVRSAPITTGSDAWFLGRDERVHGSDKFAPTDEQIRGGIVPALRAALEHETDNNIVTGCLIALARIGDRPSESGTSELEPLIAKFLADKNQEIRETAAVALGILGNARSIGLLQSLLADAPAGRALCDQPEVDVRTRAFAAHGLGLIGARASEEDDRREIVASLRTALMTAPTRTRDIQVACVIALGLVPLPTFETPASMQDEPPVPESSRGAQLEFLLAYMADDARHEIVRAHCPTALARLLQGLPSDLYAPWRARIATDLLARLEPRRKEPAPLVQSAVQALGLLGTNDGADPLDVKIRKTLAGVPDSVNDQQARNFAMIALAQIGGRKGASATKEGTDEGVEQVARALLGQLTEGKDALVSWAGIGCGILARRIAEDDQSSRWITSLQGAVRETLRTEKNPYNVAALAIAAGISGDIESAPLLIERVQSEKDDDACGSIAVALGLMNAHDSVEAVEKIVDESRYRPELLKQSAIALGLLGDKRAVPKLFDLLANAKGLATQAALASALGSIGDQRSVDPLIAMLKNEDITPHARAFAAVALGIVADKELFTWNAKIALDLNYRASVATLTEPTGTGILDIL